MVGITKSSTRLSTIVPHYQPLVNGNQSNTRTIEQRNESRKQHKRQLVAGVLGEKRRKNKPRGVGEQMAHWPRVRLTTLLAARPFLLASSQPNPRTSRERNCGRQSPSCQTERRNEVEKVFRKKQRGVKEEMSLGRGTSGNWIVLAKSKEEIRRVLLLLCCLVGSNFISFPDHDLLSVVWLCYSRYIVDYGNNSGQDSSE